MRLIIKNMNCPACKYFVEKELKELGIQYVYIEMGEVELVKTISQQRLQLLNNSLKCYGLEIIYYDDRNRIVGKAKNAILELLINPEKEKNINLQEYLSRRLKFNYSYIDRLFLEETGNSIENYYNSQKIARAIELLMHYNLSLIEIAYQLNFENVEQLQYQFLLVTGLTPMHFKQLKYDGVSSLELCN